MSAYFVIIDVFNKNSACASGKNRTCQRSSVKALCCGLLNVKG